jgi:hypothetical protein
MQPDHPSEQRASGSSEPSPPQDDEHKGVVDGLKRVLTNTRSAILAVGALVAALVAITAAAKSLLPGASAPPEASFQEARAGNEVGLRQYEATNAPQALASAGGSSEPMSNSHRLADYALPGSTWRRVDRSRATVVALSAAAAEPGSEEGFRRGLNVEERKPKEEPRESEEREIAKAAGAHTSRSEEATHTEPTPEGYVQSTQSGSIPEGASGATSEPGPAPEPFHREGNLKVRVGTGAPTKEVNNVLARARAILAADNAPFGKEGASFGGIEGVLVNISAAEPVHTPGGTPLAVPAECGPRCALRPAIDQAIADDPTNPAQAAGHIAAMFHGSRVERAEGVIEPVGVYVTYKAAFSGLLHERLLLEWTMNSDQTGQPLPREWWRNVIVKEIEPTNNGSGTTVGTFWAPVPPKRGRYSFELRLLDGTSEKAHRYTGSFP